jgi:hypothetical protein
MRRSFFRSFALLGAGLMLLGTLFAYAETVFDTSSAALTADGLITPRTRAIVNGEYAYLLGQPETVVADALISKLAPSPTRDAALIVAYKRRPFRQIALSTTDIEPSARELNLVYWDVRTRTAKTLLRESVSENNQVEIEEIGWLPRTRVALLVMNRVNRRPGQPESFTQTLLRADTVAGTVNRIADLAGGKGEQWRLGMTKAGLEVSPSQPLAYIRTDESDGNKTNFTFRGSFRVYTSQGFRSRIPLPNGVFEFSWLSDGKTVYSDRVIEKDAAGKLKIRKALTLVNLETGEVTQPDKLPVNTRSEDTKEASSLRKPWAIDIANEKATIQNATGKAQATSALWIRSLQAAQKEKTTPMPPMNGPISLDSLLIATNAHKELDLAIENTAAILFTRDGSLCAAPIFRMPAQAFEDSLRGIQRTATMKNAKQIGVAILMYTQDYDDTFPIPGDGVKDVTSPYLKNPSVFENPGTGELGFVYSYNGSTSLSSVGQPSTTQLGYVSGPDGRAVIWADGHVTWENVP